MKKTAEKPLLIIYSKSSFKKAFFEKVLQEDFEILSAESDEEFSQKLEQLKISLIILDEKTLESSPEEVCNTIQKKGVKNAPILLITSKLKKIVIQKLLQTGITDFLREPLDEDEVNERIETAKRLQKTERKVAELRAAITEKTIATKDISKRFIFDERVLNTIQNATGDKNPLSLLLIELKNCKEETLFQTKLKCFIRKQDIFFELGSGKFLVILPKTSKTAALLIAENIEESASQFPLSIALVDLEEVQTNIYFSAEHLLTLATNYLEEGKKRGTRIITKGNIL
ncbi:MAG: response regulator [Simkaniaceae bacterium]|nr:response regulator [Simkaniaceae bacterium]